MISLTILVMFLAAFLFIAGVCIIVGGVAGLAVAADIIIGIFILWFVIKLFIDR